MKKLLLATIVFSFAFSAHAATIYVDANGTGANNGSSWTDAYNFLQDALADARSDPDINQIHVAQGMYTPDTNSAEPNGTSDRLTSFALINGVALYGGFPSGGSALQDRDPNIYETILSGDLLGNDTPGLDPCDLINDPNRTDNCYHIFYHPEGFSLNSTAILDGFTITAGNADGSDRYGGGMYNFDRSSPTVINCILTGNSAYWRGGGMYNEFSDPNITNCTFSNNSTRSGGGGMYNRKSNPTVTNCTFSNNKLRENGNGGGMLNYNCSPKISNCTFSSNSGGYVGGGLVNNGLYKSWSKPNISNCTFTGNSAYYAGGMANSHGEPNITNCTFTGNSAEYQGGGMYNSHSNLNITNCKFSGNSAKYEGGGMYNSGLYNRRSNPNITNCTFTDNSAEYGGGMSNLYSDSHSTNCTFSGNSAFLGSGMLNTHSDPNIINCSFNGSSAYRGGGMYNYDSSFPTIINCILWDNIASSSGGQIYDDEYSMATVTYSDIDGGWPGIGNIDIDPCFVSPGYWDVNGTPADTNDDFWIDGDYRLLPQSLCINTGDPNYILDPNCPNDLDGNPRIVDGRIDMGAYEFPGMLGAKLFCVPRVLNTQSRRRTIVALLAMPQDILRSDINQSERLVLTPGNVIAQRQYVFQWRKRGRPCTWVMAVFNKSDCMPHLSPGQNQVEVIGKLNDGRYFYGTDTIKIINPKNKPRPNANRYRRRYK